MKSVSYALSVIALLFLTSCGVSHAVVQNQNQNSTQVHLSSNNFQIVDKVVGYSEATYVGIFGGMFKKRLFQEAYAEMVENAKLTSGSKALINIVTEEHLGGLPPVFYRRTVTVSANVIEFTK
jgi:hypothetical protein